VFSYDPTKCFRPYALTYPPLHLNPSLPRGSTLAVNGSLARLGPVGDQPATDRAIRTKVTHGIICHNLRLRRGVRLAFASRGRGRRAPQAADGSLCAVTNSHCGVKLGTNRTSLIRSPPMCPEL
jgi:hypothetical protein